MNKLKTIQNLHNNIILSQASLNNFEYFYIKSKEIRINMQISFTLHFPSSSSLECRQPLSHIPHMKYKAAKPLQKKKV